MYRDSRIPVTPETDGFSEVVKTITQEVELSVLKDVLLKSGKFTEPDAKYFIKSLEKRRTEYQKAEAENDDKGKRQAMTELNNLIHGLRKDLGEEAFKGIEERKTWV
ncbi:MAG: hypothetical protein ABIH21_03045 [Patescibacteria group bacterium]